MDTYQQGRLERNRRARRAAVLLTLDELFRLTGIVAAEKATIEEGQQAPPLLVVQKIGVVLEVDMAQLPGPAAVKLVSRG